MNIVIFGLGEHYQKNKQKLYDYPNMKVVALSDNNASLWGQKVDDVEVLHPESLQSVECDYVIIMSWLYREAIKEQLLSYGISKDKVIELNDFMEYLKYGNMWVYLSKREVPCPKGKILFITTRLGYNGGSLAIIYAALASQKLGFEPFILVPHADVNLVDEYTKEGITFFVYPNLNAASIENLYWVKGYSYYVVNTLQMMLCACELAKKHSVIWWLHEPKVHYERYKDLFEKYSKETLSKIDIYSVTNRAKENFEEKIPSLEAKELLLGIPDTATNMYNLAGQNKKMIFAVVGGIFERKGQDILLEAIEKGQNFEHKEVEFWLIGGIRPGEYADIVLEKMKSYPQVKWLGIKTRSEIEQLYKQIDVVIVCSREETLSIAAIEAMMYKKICVVSDACGIVDYMDGRLSELVYPWESADALSQKISWCIENRQQFPAIGEEGRKAYERMFSIDAFAERLKPIFK